MKKHKDVKQKEVKKKMETKKRFGISDAFEFVVTQGTENKTDAISKVMTLLRTKNITKTKNGKTIDEKVVSRQVSAMCFDIGKQRGRWKGTKLISNNDEFKLVTA